MKLLKCVLFLLILVACMITDPVEPSARDRHMVLLNCDSAVMIALKTGIGLEQAFRITDYRLRFGPLMDSRDLWRVDGLRDEVADQLQADHGISYVACGGYRE